MRLLIVTDAVFGAHLFLISGQRPKVQFCTGAEYQRENAKTKRTTNNKHQTTTMARIF